MQYHRFSTNLKSLAVIVKNSFFVFIPTIKVQSDPIKISNPVFEFVNKLKNILTFLKTIIVII